MQHGVVQPFVQRLINFEVSFMNLEMFISITAHLSALLPIACIFYRKELRVDVFKEKFVTVLLLLCFVSFLSDTICYTLAFNGLSTWLTINIYFGLFFILVFYLYLEIYKRKIILSIAFLFVAFCIVNLIWFQGPDQLNSATVYLGSFLLILYIIIILNKISSELCVVDYFDYPLYWVSMGMVLYMGSNLYPFLFNNFLLKVSALDNQQANWLFHNSMNIVKNILLTVALWKQCKNIHSSIVF
jgi:hypothetical protein